MISHYGLIPPERAENVAVTRLILRDGALELRWFHCSETAEFLGDYFAVQARAAKLNSRDAQHSIGYMANEILENAVKFRALGLGDIEIEATLQGNAFEMRVSHFVETPVGTRFQGLLTELLKRDPGELLIERIEANAADNSSGGSGLGILTLMSDYGAKLGWSFKQDEADAATRLSIFATLTLV
jgi:hypothetical protein